MMAPSASARSQNGASDGWSRYCPLVWPLIMQPRELELAHAALELVGGGLGILHRQVAEAGIAVRPLLDFAGEEVVAGARDLRTAVAASRSACTPGPAIESTARSMPAPSIDLRRSSPKSESRATTCAQDCRIDVADRVFQ